jgi:hypothetical protein
MDTDTDMDTDMDRTVFLAACQRKNCDCCWISSSFLAVCQLLNLYNYRQLVCR